jgi:hypothetical protein
MASLVTAHIAANRLPTEAGYTDGFLFLLIGAAAATIVALIIPRGSRPSAVQPRG